MVNNYYKSGPSTNKPTLLMQLTSHCTNCVAQTGNALPAKVYLQGNIVNGAAAGWNNIDMDNSETRNKEELKANAMLNARYTNNLTNYITNPESADRAYETVLTYAGASLKRDAVDERIVNQVRNNSGAIIDKVQDTPGYPDLSSVNATVITDADKDGMPDDWEEQQLANMGVIGKTFRNLLPNAYNLSAQYTNLEMYLNSLVTATFPNNVLQ